MPQAMVNQAGTVVQLHSWSDIFGLEDRSGCPDLHQVRQTDPVVKTRE